MKAILATAANIWLARKLNSLWRDKPIVELHPDSIRHLLVIELGGLGDAVNVLPILAVLKERLARASLSIVCRDYVQAIFTLIPGHQLRLKKIVGIPKSQQGLDTALQELSHDEWDLVVSTCWSTWATALALRLRAKALCGFWRPWQVECFGLKVVSDVQVRCSDHLEMLRFKAVTPLGIPIPTFETLPLPKIDPKATNWDSVLSRHSELKEEFIAFVPFCEDRGKSLSLSESLHAYKALRQNNVSIYLLGGKAERAKLTRLASQVRQNASSQPSVVTDLTIPEFAAVLQKAKFVLSVDTGAMHLAAAVGTPTIGVFKSTNPRRCGVRGERMWCVSYRDFTAPNRNDDLNHWLEKCQIRC